MASPARTTAELRRAISEDSSSPRLLICAPSNAAIDEILLRLYQQGIYTYQASSNQASIDTTPKSRIPKIVRLGDVITENHSAQSSQIIQSLTLTYQVDQALLEDPLWQERQALLAAIRDAELQLTEEKRNNTTTANGSKPSNHSSHGNSNQTQQESTLKATQAGLQRLKVQLNRNLMAIEKRKTELRLQILFEAEVVGSTLSSSGKQHFLDYIIKENVLFHTTIIDEAAQTTEPASLIPLRFGCRRLVLVGDPRQLPATVLSRSAERAGLGRSLFERLEQAEHEVVMLTVQYRMHPDIRKFPSLYFYQNLLIDAPHIQQEMTLRAILLQQRQIQERNLLMDVDAKEDGEIADEDEEGEEVHASHCTMTVTTRLITEQSTLFAHDSDCHHSTDATAAAAAAAAASAVRISPNRPLASVTFYHIGVDSKSQVGETTSADPLEAPRLLPMNSRMPCLTS
jgi:superfamily I DNA and/or RNA helicase